MPSKTDMSENQPTDLITMPHLDGMSRTFDFHDMGLFLEIECPGNAQVTIVRCSRPQNSHNPVVEVDKIEPGRSREIDMGEDFCKPHAMFLSKRNSKGIDQWWDCRWKNR